MESAAFHDALCSSCPSYKELSDVKLRGWKSKTYVRPHVILAKCHEYAQNYAEHFLPKLEIDDAYQMRRKFCDMGAAPGGLCQCLLEAKEPTGERNKWYGVALTLDPEQGGIDMRYKHESLEVRFANVHNSENFLKTALAPGDEKSFAFVNMGIVVDGNVKRYLDEGIPYYQQLTTQMQATERLLAPNGSFMIVLNLDYPSLPEVLGVIHTLIKHSKSVHIIPTVYTRSAARKQFYLLVNKITLTTEIVQELSNTWKSGYERQMSRRKRRLQERKDEERDETAISQSGFSADYIKEVVQSIMTQPFAEEFSGFCDMLTEAILEGHFA